MRIIHISTIGFRLVQMTGMTDANGESLIAVLPPGPNAIPIMYRTIEAALGGKARMEGAR